MFVFGPNYGSDQIQDFNAPQGDTIHVNITGIDNFADLMAVGSNTTQGAVFQMGLSSITLVDVDLDDLGPDLFTFETSDAYFA